MRKFKTKGSSCWLGSYASCMVCDFEQFARNAVGLAAQHTQRTGHETITEVTRAVSFKVDRGDERESDADI